LAADGALAAKHKGYYVEIILDLNKHAKFKEQAKAQGGAAGAAGARGAAGAAGAAGIAGAAGFGGRPGIAGAAGFGGAAGAAGAAGFGGRPGIAGAAGFGGAAGVGGAFAGGAMGGKGGTGKPEPKKLVRVIVEAPQLTKFTQGKTVFYYFSHKWGRTVFPASDIVDLNSAKRIEPLKDQYEARRKKAYPKDGKPVKDKLIELADWVLKHGMVNEFPKIMDDLAKLDPAYPAVAAYKQIAGPLKARLSEVEPSSRWLEQRLKERGYQTKPSDHFMLLTNSGNTDEIDARVQLLEDTYKTFFYWFALKGKALQLPRYRLVDVLVASRPEFKEHSVIFKSIPRVEDGFTALRDNVSIFSGKPLDPDYMRLESQNDKILGDTDRKRLIEGRWGLRCDINVANKQVFTLVQKAMEEEMERTTVTHGVIRQLLAAAGLPAQSGVSARIPVLARNLAGPEWLRFGLASFFETSRGAYWPGGTVPSWNYWVQFKFARQDKKLDNIKEVLENVITDQYFLDAAGGDVEKTEFARTTAWALTYYLASDENFEKLMTYLHKVAKLPRHMKLSKPVLRTLFQQTFGDLDTVARRWLAYMLKDVSPEEPKIFDDAKEIRKLMKVPDETKDDSSKPPNGYRPPNGFKPPDGFKPPMGFKPPQGFRPPDGRNQ
jgi:hypothetical protein